MESGKGIFIHSALMVGAISCLNYCVIIKVVLSLLLCYWYLYE